MRFALLNSGLGLLAPASELHRLRPDADLVLSMDPDGMPWGPRAPEDIAERSLLIARAAAAYQPDVMVMACNTATVHALDLLRAEFEPDIPIVGTVPAIKPAARRGGSVAVWATVGTTSSDYQRRLIAEHGGRATVIEVACPGLASAVDAGDRDATVQAIADAGRRTPGDCTAVVLGCTEYELADDLVGAAVPGAALFGSAAAVAAQALRVALANGRPGSVDGVIAGSAASGTPAAGIRSAGTLPAGTLPAGTLPAGTLPADTLPAGTRPTGTLRVLLSGRPAELPLAAMRYRQGRELARLAAGHDPAADLLL
ncbi:MAG: glutamate racemase [Streptosporangiaceae bacterium]